MEMIGYLSVDKPRRLHRSAKNGKLIAYTGYGKVIVIKNQKSLHNGFAKITSYEDAGNCFVANMENVVCDFYYSYDDKDVIPYDELQKVFESFGYVHEYTEPINDNNNFHVWANLDIGSIITIEEWNNDGRKTYNSVKMWIPTHDTTFCTSIESSGFSHGGYNVCCFDLVNNRFEHPIRELLKLCDHESKDWKGEVPSLWHYGYGEDVDFIKASRTLYKFKDADEIMKSFNIDVEGRVNNILEFWKGSDKYKEYRNERNSD